MTIFNYFTCDCFAAEHTLRFIWDEEEKELYTQIQLNLYASFWLRLLMAFWYVLGMPGRDQHWDCWQIRGQELKRFVDFVKELDV